MWQKRFIYSHVEKPNWMFLSILVFKYIFKYLDLTLFADCAYLSLALFILCFSGRLYVCAWTFYDTYSDVSVGPYEPIVCQKSVPLTWAWVSINTTCLKSEVQTRLVQNKMARVKVMWHPSLACHIAFCNFFYLPFYTPATPYQ